jgi:nicotinamide mononucleotide adenylyltransferase
MSRQLYPPLDAPPRADERVHRLEEQVREVAEAVRMLARALADIEEDPAIWARVAETLRTVEHPRNHR